MVSDGSSCHKERTVADLLVCRSVSKARSATPASDIQPVDQGLSEVGSVLFQFVFCRRLINTANVTPSRAAAAPVRPEQAARQSARFDHSPLQPRPHQGRSVQIDIHRPPPQTWSPSPGLRRRACERTMPECVGRPARRDCIPDRRRSSLSYRLPIDMHRPDRNSEIHDHVFPGRFQKTDWLGRS